MSAVNITFRASQLPANIPTTTTVKGTPLTHLELDGNLLSLRDAILARAMAHNAALTGIPTAPTAAPGNNTTQLATTAFVATESDARSYRALNGRAIPLADNTNLQEWADTLPPSGIYNVHLTAPQGALPAGMWYLELIVHDNSSPVNLWHTITATQLDGASGIKFTNTRRSTAWGGWVRLGAPAATETVSGISRRSTTAEAQAGTEDTAHMTALKTAQASDARSYRALNGRAIPLADNTNLQEWADTLPPSGIYNVHLTAPQGNLPTGWWYLELLVHHGASVPTNMHSTITATLLNGASGIKFTNTRTNAGWGGWVRMVPVAATDAVSGIVELATGAEAAAGTDGARVLSPAALRAGLNATGSAPVFGCRAWVNFNGTNGAIRASGNVTSVTRLSAGIYTINFATAMPDANYGFAGMAQGATPENYLITIAVDRDVAPTVSAIRVRTGMPNGFGAVDVATDPAWASVVIFR